MQHLFKMPEQVYMPIYARTDHFPNCCGIDVITGFPHPTKKDEPTKVRASWMPAMFSYSEDKDENKHLIENCRKDVKHLRSTNSVVLVVLNHIQNKIYKDMLGEEGFKLVHGDAYHSGHGHTLFLYARNTYERNTPTSNI